MQVTDGRPLRQRDRKGLSARGPYDMGDDIEWRTIWGEDMDPAYILSLSGQHRPSIIGMDEIIIAFVFVLDLGLGYFLFFYFFFGSELYKEIPSDGQIIWATGLLFLRLR